MNFIAHRINTIDELKKIPHDFGVELDLRDDCDGRLFLQHDPFKDGEDFEEYLKHYNHGTMILNIKSERIEYKVLELISKYNVKDYFFLDSSFPMIYLLTESGNPNVALRFSELEGLDTILNMKGKANWIWVDCLSKLTITENDFKILKANGFKLCLVSPDLYGRDVNQIGNYKNYLGSQNIIFDAICCKVCNIKRWE